MATNKNFVVKNGLIVGGQEVISSSGVVTSAALGGQTLSSTDSPTFANLTVSNDLAVSGDLNLTGDLNITGNVNTLSVTDLDVTDQTITLGAGQVESASGGSGIIVDGSLASILWDETNTEWDINNTINVTGAVISSSNGAITTASGTTARFTVNETGGAITAMDARGSTGNIGTRSNHTLGFLVNDVQKATLTAGGDFTVTNDLKLTTNNPRIDYDGGISGSLRFFSTSASQERARITSSGNVGIGTLNPLSKLHIQGNSDSGDAYCQLIIEDTDTDSGSQIPSIQFMADGNNTVRMRGTSTEGLVISGSSAQGDDLVVQAGGVGIGTATVNALLHIKGTGDAIRVESTNAGAGGAQLDLLHYTASPANEDINGTINFGGYYSGTSAAYASAIRSIWTDVGARHGRIEFLTRDDAAFANAMTISHDSKVGIGTGSTANSYKFTVNSGTDNVVADFVSSDGTAAIRLRDSGGNVELSTTSGDFRVQPSGGAYAFRVETNGNGTFIGSASGTSFYGTSYIQGDTGVVKGDTTYGAIFGSNSASRGVMIARDASASYPDIYIKGSNGYIGFDQNSPQYPMHYGDNTVIPNGRNLNWDLGEIYPANQYLTIGQTAVSGTTRPTSIGLQLYDDSTTENTFAPAISWSHQSTSTSFSQSSAAIAGRRTAAVSGDTNWHGGELHLYTAKPTSQGLRDTASLIINTYAQAHLGAGDSDTRLYLGSQGGAFGANSSNWIRGSTSNLMYNAGGGAHIWEVGGAQRLSVASTGVITQQTAGSGDGYDIISRSTDGGDPGLELTRNGVVGFGIAVRGATDDYADFQVNSSGSPSYTEAGKLRLYSGGGVHMPGSHVFNADDGFEILAPTGRIFQTFNYNSTGAEVFLQNNRFASGTVAAFQYRISNSPQTGGTIYASTSGYTGGNFSDYRLKNNVTNLAGSLDKICQLRAVSYNHVATPDKTELGFIAHEIAEVFPEFVHGEKDAVWTQEDIDNYQGHLPDVEVGDIKAQQVEYFSKEWTTHILLAIKELKQKNDELKARIEALENT